MVTLPVTVEFLHAADAPTEALDPSSVETLCAAARSLHILADDPDSLRRRADQLRGVLRGLTDARAIEVLKGEIADLETKAQRLEGSSPRKP